MIIVGTHNARNHIHLGWQILAEGGAALDAVEAVTRAVEADPEEHSVGVGGWPNLVGELELDASIMDGRERSCGAVAAIRGFAHPISIARMVMERLPHVLLAGGGAEDFAREHGFPPQQTVTPLARQTWRERLEDHVPERDRSALLERRKMTPYALLASDPKRIHGTVNVLAQDRNSHLASAVSTSGWAWKYPGRVGDSPLIGAGNYCDDRYGAVACTGHGERAIRTALCRAVLAYVEMGLSMSQACRRALRDVPSANPVHEGPSEKPSILVLLAIDRLGNPVCLTNSKDAWGWVSVRDTTSGPVPAKPIFVDEPSQ